MGRAVSIVVTILAGIPPILYIRVVFVTLFMAEVRG